MMMIMIATSLLTCYDGLERCSGNRNVAVLDHDHVVAGSHRRVGELIAFRYLGTDQGHLRRSVDHHCQRACTRVRRHHRELGWLAYTSTYAAKHTR